MDLKKLTDKKLNELRAEVALEIEQRMRSNQPRSLTLFFDSISDTLEAHRVNKMSFAAIRNNRELYKSLVSAHQETDLLLLYAWSDGTCSVQQRHRAYFIIASLVYDWCDSIPDVPISFKLMLSQYSRVKSIFNRAFPGYLAMPAIARLALDQDGALAATKTRQKFF